MPLLPSTPASPHPDIAAPRRARRLQTPAPTLRGLGMRRSCADPPFGNRLLLTSGRLFTTSFLPMILAFAFKSATLLRLGRLHCDHLWRADRPHVASAADHRGGVGAAEHAAACTEGETAPASARGAHERELTRGTVRARSTRPRTHTERHIVRTARTGTMPGRDAPRCPLCGRRRRLPSSCPRESAPADPRGGAQARARTRGSASI